MPSHRGGSVLPFLLLTFLWSWTFWAFAVPAFRARGMDEAGPWPYLALLLGAYGPSLMAVVLTRRENGWPGVRRLLGGFLRWRGRALSLVAALFLPFLLRLVALGLFVAVAAGSASLDFSRAHLAAVVLVVSMPFGPLAEEVFFRGYVLRFASERAGPYAFPERGPRAFFPPGWLRSSST